jgi:hypothetical protein
MGMLLMVLTHLMLFVPIRNSWKVVLITLPFLAAALDEGSSWLVRFGSADFAILKVAGFLLLQGSLAALIIVSLWSVLTQTQAANYTGFVDDEDEDDDDL